MGYNISFQLCDFLSHNESITDDLPIPNWLLLWSGILFLGFRSPVFRLWMIRQSIPNRIQTQFFQFTPITYKKLKITGYLSSFIALKSSCSEPAFISRKTRSPSLLPATAVNNMDFLSQGYGRLTERLKISQTPILQEHFHWHETCCELPLVLKTLS